MGHRWTRYPTMLLRGGPTSGAAKGHMATLRKGRKGGGPFLHVITRFEGRIHMIEKLNELFGNLSVECFFFTMFGLTLLVLSHVCRIIGISQPLSLPWPGVSVISN